MLELKTFISIVKDFSIPLMIPIALYAAFYMGKTYNMLSAGVEEMKNFKKKACVSIKEEREVNVKQNERLSIIEAVQETQKNA